MKKTLIPASTMRRYSVILKLEEKSEIGKNHSPYKREWLVLKDDKLISAHRLQSEALKAIREDVLGGSHERKY
jgi:hypothetical protein